MKKDKYWNSRVGFGIFVGVVLTGSLIALIVLVNGNKNKSDDENEKAQKEKSQTNENKCSYDDGEITGRSFCFLNSSVWDWDCDPSLKICTLGDETNDYPLLTVKNGKQALSTYPRCAAELSSAVASDSIENKEPGLFEALNHLAFRPENERICPLPLGSTRLYYGSIKERVSSSSSSTVRNFISAGSFNFKGEYPDEDSVFRFIPIYAEGDNKLRSNRGGEAVYYQIRTILSNQFLTAEAFDDGKVSLSASISEDTALKDLDRNLKSEKSSNRFRFHGYKTGFYIEVENKGLYICLESESSLFIVRKYKSEDLCLFSVTELNPSPIPDQLPVFLEIISPTAQPSSFPTLSPTSTPLTSEPTTPKPTPRPIPQPTPYPTPNPTPVPSAYPTPNPTPAPSAYPTPNPTPAPSAYPTPKPTPRPIPQPTPYPTPNPTPAPSAYPTPNPTPAPSAYPTPNPTRYPTSTPTSSSPTLSPTDAPTKYTPPTIPPDAHLLPNIIFILADDMGVGDTSIEGYRSEINRFQIQTPQLERMANSGMIFNAAYSDSPVCGPSRISIMTGKHTGISRVRGNTGERGIDFAIPPNEETFIETLKKKGYDNFLIGKWGFGTSDARPPSHPLDVGFDAFFGQLTHKEAHINMPAYVHNHSIDGESGRRNVNRKVYYDKNKDANKGVCTSNPDSCDFVHDQYTAEALKYITKMTTTSPKQPFFLYVAYTGPHVGSWEPIDKLKDYSSEIRKVAPISTCPVNFQVKDNVMIDEECRHEAIVRDYLDKDIGLILDKVESLGISEKTMVVFAADNGPNGELFIRNKKVHDLDTFKSTANMRGGKREVFEGGIRTPLVIQWKGVIKPGTTSDVPTSLADLYATFLEAGRATHLILPSNQVSPPSSESLLPYLKGEKQNSDREYLYFEYCEQQSVNWKKIRRNPDTYCSWALRGSDGWKLLFDSRDKTYYLFDLKFDPYEKHNLYDVEPDIVSRMNLAKEKAHIPLQDIGYQGQTRWEDKVQ